MMAVPTDQTIGRKGCEVGNDEGAERSAVAGGDGRDRPPLRT